MEQQVQSNIEISEDWIQEQHEWLESFEEIIKQQGAEKARELLHKLRYHSIRNGVSLDGETLNTPYINTISLENQPSFPGDIELERKIENIHKWNAMCMVLQGYDQGTGIGGHIATYASASTMYEVGFNHFFKNKTATYGGDLIGFQPHAAPGIYARAFLEGRLSFEQVSNFRRELQPKGGLPSYPHPRRMPDFWETPSASMGLNPVSAIYQARFQKYLENRGLKEKNGGRVWAFIGDGEMDEPEILGTINIAAREQLDNLTFVVNCNLQRLDGPVRGNGKIIQELERSFLGSGWDVNKVIWGGEWDSILLRDKDGILVERMNKALDGDYQLYSVLSGEEVRAHWVKDNPDLETLMQSLSDEQIRTIKRGGHDLQKIYAAFNDVTNEKQHKKPTVVLIKTLKGDGMGSVIEGRNTAHQKKSMTAEERIDVGMRLGIPLSKKEMAQATFYKPAENSPEIQYLKEHRKEMGGYLPNRTDTCEVLKIPSNVFKEFFEGTKGREASTTMVLVKIIANLLKDKSIGKYIVPIIPDEARTFGLDGLFKFAGIYQPKGQQYKPVDAHNLSYYRESIDGQILQEGICEAGGIASFMAAGTSYALHSVPTIPFYVFYSMFGFQRVGDMIWACGDMLTKGFLLGGTAGRTTLNGEGVQHQDGHSQLVANTVPNLKSYDPAFSYELAEIIKDGMCKMYEKHENIFYYITIYNENYEQPAMPKEVEKGIIKGMYRFKKSPKAIKKAHILASGPIIQQALEAVSILEEFSIATDIWSVTSFNELSRDANTCERWNMLHPLEDPKKPYISELLENEDGVFVAVSDYIKMWSGSIAKWIPNRLTILGTDGYGLSESREAIRDYFEISAKYIALAVLTNLYKEKQISKKEIQTFIKKYNIDTEKINPITA